MVDKVRRPYYDALMTTLHYDVESLEILDSDPNIVGTARCLVRDLLALHKEFAQSQIGSLCATGAND